MQEAVRFHGIFMDDMSYVKSNDPRGIYVLRTLINRPLYWVYL